MCIRDSAERDVRAGRRLAIGAGRLHRVLRRVAGRYCGLSVAMSMLSWWLTGGTLRYFVPWYIAPLRRYWAETQMPGSSWVVTGTSRTMVESGERITRWLRRSRPSKETSTGAVSYT